MIIKVVWAKYGHATPTLFEWLAPVYLFVLWLAFGWLVDFFNHNQTTKVLVTLSTLLTILLFLV
jgi:hypothetical protein